jgi:hypothetical protein
MGVDLLRFFVVPRYADAEDNSEFTCRSRISRVSENPVVQYNDKSTPNQQSFIRTNAAHLP